VDAVLADWRSAPIDARLKAACHVVETLTLDPESLTPADLAPLRAAGATGEAIEDLVHVCAIFNMYDRLADALGFDLPGSEAFDRLASVLLIRGYR